MTEIKIEKKAAIWPWLLLAIGVLAAVWFFFLRNNDVKPVEEANKISLIDVQEGNRIVASYVLFINSDTNTMRLDHTFTIEAIVKLTTAVDAMATEVNYDVKDDIAKAKQLANEITRDSFSTIHAE